MGVKGEHPGRLSAPGSLAVDFAGNVYLADPGSVSVHKFAANGTPLLSFQDPGLTSPDDIAVDRAGAIYVSDGKRGSVFIFHPDGTRYREMRCVPRRRQKQRLSVAVDEAGQIFVADSVTSRVQKFSPRRRLLRVWGGKGSRPGRMDVPSDVAVGPAGALYVSHAANHRIAKFSRNGEYLTTFEAPSGPADPAAVMAVAASDRCVFAADSAARRLYAWTVEGRLVLNEDLSSLSGAPSVVPGDVAASPPGDLFVLDLAGPRVLRFHINF